MPHEFIKYMDSLSTDINESLEIIRKKDLVT